MRKGHSPDTPDLFVHAAKDAAATDPDATPLAERMRPKNLDELVGQARLFSPGSALRRAIEADRIGPMILWGPPGAGKTTLARLLSHATKARFVGYSAVLGSVAEVRVILEQATEARAYRRQRTILFVDEIHRFNRTQQDAFLPSVEDGTLVLIGATTENPSFAVNAALLSRCRIIRLEALSEESLLELAQKALLDDVRGLGKRELSAEPEALLALVRMSSGDARRLLSALETCADLAAPGGCIDVALVTHTLGVPSLRYDKKGDEHYGVVSAFIKSMRGSDPDASLYWMARMLESGEDPLFVLRRLLIFASEDVGNADPRALSVVVAADEAFRRMGMPEGIHPIAQACCYLATAPKSNASIVGYRAAEAAVKQYGSLEVPKSLRPSTGRAGAELGWGEGYVYSHDHPEVPQTFLPEKLQASCFYEPKESGHEQKIKAWLDRRRTR